MATHLEIVTSNEMGRRADRFEQLVLYLPDGDAVHTVAASLRQHGLTREFAVHPYWAANHAVVFLDPDGRGVVLAPWIYGREVNPVDREAHQ